jgi:hypothetical protein
MDIYPRVPHTSVCGFFDAPRVPHALVCAFYPLTEIRDTENILLMNPLRRTLLFIYGGSLTPGTGKGFKDAKLLSSGIALLTALLIICGMLGCNEIRKMKLANINPALQAISYDVKNLKANRHAYTFGENGFVELTRPPTHPGTPFPSPFPDAPPIPGDLPPAWDVRNAVYTDLTGDGVPEYALLVWRPWRDWPFMEWSDSPSLIADCRDAQGDSCHIILIDPCPEDNATDSPLNAQSYREIWAGSPLRVPLIKTATGDVDGDEETEMIAIEGDYSTGRDGPGTRVAVWQWNGFGFTMQWRSEPIHCHELALEDITGDHVADIIIW